MAFLTIRSRLIFILTMILLFGFLTTNFMSYFASRESVRTGIIENSLPLARDNIYSEIQRDLMRPIFVSSLMANDTFLKDWALSGEVNTSLITNYLSEIKNKYNFFSSFFISEQTLNYYHFNGILKQISTEDAHDVWYYDFKDMNVEYDLVVDTNEAAQNYLTIFINHRLIANGKFLGVVGVGLNFDMVAKLLDTYREKYGRNIYMVSPDGLIQVHTDRERILKDNILHLEGIRQIAPTLLTNREFPASFEYDIRDRHVLLTTRFIKELGWHLLVEQDEGKALLSIRNTLFRNLLTSFLVTLCTIGITLLTVNLYQKKREELIAELAFKNQEIESDLKAAEEVQKQLFVSFSPPPFLSIAARYLPHSHVSGDIYKMCADSNHTYSIFVGDSTGHGVTAGLTTIMANILLDQRPGSTPTEILQHLNNVLCMHLPEERFMSAVHVTITDQGELKTASAGHPPLIIIPADGQEAFLVENQTMVLGLFESPTFQPKEFYYQMQPGDKGVLYTDGIVERVDSTGTIFGFKWLYDFIQAQASLSPEALLEAVLNYQHANTMSNSQEDDITLVVFEYVRSS
ncbi:MAG: SpoIIE family protein phosphatase [SAR324 cluster bacterium]|nr:SpoIIE family protein phosphatase [SAR324 cluster bacterium]